MDVKIEIIQVVAAIANELARVKKQVWEITYREIYPSSNFNNFNFENETQKFYKKKDCEVLSIDEDYEDKLLPQIKFAYCY